MNWPSGLNDLKAKVDNLDIGKLRTTDCKRWTVVMSKKVVKNTKLNTLNTTVNELKKKFADGSMLI